MFQLQRQLIRTWISFRVCDCSSVCLYYDKRWIFFSKLKYDPCLCLWQFPRMFTYQIHLAFAVRSVPKLYFFIRIHTQTSIMFHLQFLSQATNRKNIYALSPHTFEALLCRINQLTQFHNTNIIVDATNKEILQSIVTYSFIWSRAHISI